MISSQIVCEWLQRVRALVADDVPQVQRYRLRYATDVFEQAGCMSVCIQRLRTKE